MQVGTQQPAKRLHQFFSDLGGKYTHVHFVMMFYFVHMYVALLLCTHDLCGTIRIVTCCSTMLFHEATFLTKKFNIRRELGFTEMH